MLNSLVRHRYVFISAGEKNWGHTSKEVVKLGFEIRKSGSCDLEPVILEPLLLPGFKNNLTEDLMVEKNHWVVGLLSDAKLL